MIVQTVLIIMQQLIIPCKPLYTYIHTYQLCRRLHNRNILPTLFLGSDGNLAQLAYDIAAAKGFKIPFENVALFGSHSHSGPGAITPEMLWALAPATDLLIPGSREAVEL